MDLNVEIITKAWEVFRISALKPYQLLVIYRIMEQERYKVDRKRDQIVILPTGTGKSLCFLLPALMCKGITIIVYPLLSLMNDQILKLKEANIECVNLRGGQSVLQRSKAFEKLKKGRCKIVITNPETLCQQSVMKALSGLRISLFVCDEAHVIEKWGNRFRPAYMELGKNVDKLKPDQILAFTATASKETVKTIQKCLFKENALVVRGDADRENIYYETHLCSSKKAGLAEVLRTCEKPAVVFCRTREETFDNCINSMRKNHSVPMRYYNAGLTKEEREELEKWFLESNNGVMFATNAYGLGVDKKNIRSVIHYSLPDDAEEYLQESGRAGRDGQKASAIVLVSQAEKSIENKGEVLKVFTTDSCRRSALLALLGQNKDECTGCDVCDNRVMGTPQSSRIIEKAVKFYPFRYSAESLSLMLAGIDRKEKDNPFFGRLRGLGFESIHADVLLNPKITKSYDLLYPNSKFFYKLKAKAVFLHHVVHRFVGKIQKAIRILP